MPNSMRAFCCVGVMGIGLLMLNCSLSAAEAAGTQAGPKLEFVQVVRSGEDGVSMGKGIHSIQVHGEYLYVSTGTPATITWFKRDPATGHVEEIATMKEGRGQVLARMAFDSENGFLYAGSTGWDGTSGNLFVIRTEKK